MNNSLVLVFELLAALLVLIPLNGLIINSIGYLGQKLKFSREFLIVLVVGFTVSLPELLIAINSWFFNQQELALGNALGSGIIMISLIAGVVAIFNKNFKTNKIFSSKQLIFMSLAASLNIILAMDGRISRSDGVLLIIVYCIYLYTLVAHKHSYSITEHSTMPTKKTILNLLVFIFALAGAAIAAYYVNVVGHDIYVTSGFSLFFIGMIMVAPLGAIPELLFEIELNRQGKSTLALGELFTSLVTNTTLIIGITAVVTPFNISNNIVYYFAAMFFIVMLGVFNYFIHSRNSLDWKEGILLIISFLVFMVSAMSLMFP